MFHPSFRSQIDQLGNTYQRQQAEAMRLQQEVMFFFEYSQSILKKLIDQNNLLLEKIRNPNIPDELCTGKRHNCLTALHR